MRLIIITDDRGAGLVEYALLVMMIAIGSLVTISAVGDSSEAPFHEIAAGFESESEAELTPDEKWDVAKDVYDEAIEDAKAEKAEALAAAKAAYDNAKQENASLPKQDKKAANKEAKSEFDQAKKEANSNYKEAVNKAKADKAEAKKEWQATK